MEMKKSEDFDVQSAVLALSEDESDSISRRFGFKRYNIETPEWEQKQFDFVSTHILDYLRQNGYKFDSDKERNAIIKQLDLWVAEGFPRSWLNENKDKLFLTPYGYCAGVIDRFGNLI